MHPIFARYGSIFIYSYTVLLVFGILVGIGLTAWSKRSGHYRGWFDVVLIILSAAILGGRLGFVFFNWNYFQDRIGESWQFSQGGLSYHPALWSGLLALFIWSRIKKVSFYDTAGMLAPAFVLFVAFAWAACWFEGCAYGREGLLGPLTADLPDDLGVYAVRYQTQLSGFMLTLIVFGLILLISRRMNSMVVFWLALGSVSFIHLLTSLLRGDPAYEFVGIRLDIWVDGLIVLITLVFLIYAAGHQKTAIE